MVFFMHFRVNVQNGGYCFGVQKFQIFFGSLGFPELLGGEGYMLGRSLRIK